MISFAWRRRNGTFPDMVLLVLGFCFNKNMHTSWSVQKSIEYKGRSYGAPFLHHFVFVCVVYNAGLKVRQMFVLFMLLCYSLSSRLRSDIDYSHHLSLQCQISPSKTAHLLTLSPDLEPLWQYIPSFAQNNKVPLGQSVPLRRCGLAEWWWGDRARIPAVQSGWLHP